MQTFTHTAIGVIHTPFSQPKGTPIQPPSGAGIKGTIEIYPEYVEGLVDLDGFSHIILIYQLHLAKSSSLMVKPFLDNVNHGVFATRSPGRPNGIGLSVVPLRGIAGNIVQVEDMDIVDGTPLLDIKPYVPEFDTRSGCCIGWMTDNVKKMPSMRDDGRFVS